MQKKEITKQEYLQLEGIRALSNKLNTQLEDLVQVVASITGEKLDEHNYGLASDFIYFKGATVQEYLKKIGVAISRRGIFPRI